MPRIPVTTSLRQILRETDAPLANRLDVLWEIARGIHSRQERPGESNSGTAHCSAVESNVWRLITESGQENNFSALDLFLLSAAACCHDFDKGLQNSLPGEFHGQESGRFVVEKAGELVLDFAESVSVNYIIGIHNRKRDYQRALWALPDTFAVGNQRIDLRRLALLLKAGDVLHADSSRIDPLCTNPDTLDDLSRRKLLARKCTVGWGVNGDRIVFNVLPRNNEEKAAFESSWRYMNEDEWKPIEQELRAYGFPWRLEVEFLHFDTTVPAPRAGTSGDTCNEVTTRSHESAQLSCGPEEIDPLLEGILIEELVHLVGGNVGIFLAIVIPAGFPEGIINTQMEPRVAYFRFATSLRGLERDAKNRVFAALVGAYPGSAVVRRWLHSLQRQ